MDIKSIDKIFRFITEHVELLSKAKKLLNFYYEEELILSRTNGVTLSRQLLKREIKSLEDVISDCVEKIELLDSEFYKITGRHYIDERMINNE